MVEIRTDTSIGAVREAGRIVARALGAGQEAAAAGVRPRDLDEAALRCSRLPTPRPVPGRRGRHSTVGLAHPEDQRLIRTAEERSTRASPPSSATAWATRPSLHRGPCASRGPAADPHGGGALDPGIAAVVGNRVGDTTVTPPRALRIPRTSG
jgi:hypothetical protein